MRRETEDGLLAGLDPLLGVRDGTLDQRSADGEDALDRVVLGIDDGAVFDVEGDGAVGEERHDESEGGAWDEHLDGCRPWIVDVLIWSESLM
jgi:hypothetical protein